MPADPANLNVYPPPTQNTFTDNHHQQDYSQQPYHHQHDYAYPNQEDSSSSEPLRLEGQESATEAEPLSESIYITPPGKILVLQTLTTLSTIVFTVLPVVIKAGADATWGQWYSWRDACRFIEPFCSGLLHTWFFYSSDLMRPCWDHQQSFWSTGYYAETGKPSFLDKSTGHIPLDDRTFGQKNNSNNSHNHNDLHYAENNNSPAAAASRAGKQQITLSPVQPKTTNSVKDRSRFKSTLSAIFTFFLIVYVTGAAIHTAAAFFKNTIVLFLEQHSQGIGLSTHPVTDGDGQLSMVLAQQLKEGYLLIQDVWEHTVSHYMYALGALGMSWCEMIAYSGQVLPEGMNLARVGHLKKDVVLTEGMPVRSSKRLVFLWIVAGVLYGGIVAGVACQYPKGLYVGLGYVVALLLVVSSYILLSRTGGLFSLGRHYILQSYLIGGVVAAVAIVIYMAVHHFDMLTSNDKSHMGSIDRP
ncbi:hypothetical protein BGX28_006783 [Mortierella sp. GBA30]|nr:hypothetical protein BGX28_006783 [Mortierella sp. GBA30]